MHAITEYHTRRNWTISQCGIAFLSVKLNLNFIVLYSQCSILELILCMSLWIFEDSQCKGRHEEIQVSIQTHTNVYTEPHREGIWCWSIATAVEVHPQNMAVNVLWLQVSRGCDILEGFRSSEVGIVEETSPACHCHIHFSRMEDPSPFPLSLDDSHQNNKGPWGLCVIIFLSSWEAADHCRNTDTDSLLSASVWQDNTSRFGFGRRGSGKSGFSLDTVKTQTFGDLDNFYAV